MIHKQAKATVTITVIKKSNFTNELIPNTELPKRKESEFAQQLVVSLVFDVQKLTSIQLNLPTLLVDYNVLLHQSVSTPFHLLGL